MENIEFVKMLLDSGHSYTLAQQSMALVCAMTRGNTDILNLFLDRGFDVNGMHRDGRTPLTVAWESHTSGAERMQFLLARGADIFATRKATSSKYHSTC